MIKKLAALMFVSSLAQAADPIAIDVYRDPNCGCCVAWIEHLEENGFKVTDHLHRDMSALKAEVGVPRQLASCHTGLIDGRFVEGHVPAADILLMRDEPDLLGVAVPGMPLGSPGMEVGNRVDAYEVIGVDAQGQQRVLANYP